LPDRILKKEYPRTLLAKFGENWSCGFRGDVEQSIFLFLIKEAIFESDRTCHTQFLKRSNQGLFLSRLAKIGPVVKQEMLKVDISI
jgi:hypothetical protein